MSAKHDELRDRIRAGEDYRIEGETVLSVSVGEVPAVRLYMRSGSSGRWKAAGLLLICTKDGKPWPVAEGGNAVTVLGDFARWLANDAEAES